MELGQKFKQIRKQMNEDSLCRNVSHSGKQGQDQEHQSPHLPTDRLFRRRRTTAPLLPAAGSSGALCPAAAGSGRRRFLFALCCCHMFPSYCLNSDTFSPPQRACCIRGKKNPFVITKGWMQ